MQLLGAIPDVLDAAPDTSFVIVGGPPLLTGPEVAAQWVDGLDAFFAGRVRFTGWQSPANVSKWYAAADILAVPSRYEPFGMVILEGMLYGLAVVAADVGGPAEILSHGRTGVLFPARNGKALAAALTWMPILSSAGGSPWQARSKCASVGGGKGRFRKCWTSIASSRESAALRPRPAQRAFQFGLLRNPTCFFGARLFLDTLIKRGGLSAKSNFYAAHVTASATASSSGAKVEQTRSLLRSGRPR